MDNAKIIEIILNYSLNVEKGDFVFINGTDVINRILPDLVSSILKKGACVDYQIKDQDIDEIILNLGSPAQISNYYECQNINFKKYNKMINFISERNQFAKKNLSELNLAAYYASRKEQIIQFLNRVEAGELECLNILFPSTGYAQYSKMSNHSFEKMYEKVCFLDHETPIEKLMELEAYNELLIKKLVNCSNIHIVGKSTNLKMSVEGRLWINGSGKINLPDGEIFTTPIKESVNGFVKFDYPLIYDGFEIKDIILKFDKGRVVDYQSSNNKILEKILAVDEGAKYLGEIGFGTNFNATHFCGNIIFDEKMGGTVHLALGSAFGQCGGSNFFKY